MFIFVLIDFQYSEQLSQGICSSTDSTLAAYKCLNALCKGCLHNLELLKRLLFELFYSGNISLLPMINTWLWPDVDKTCNPSFLLMHKCKIKSVTHFLTLCNNCCHYCHADFFCKICALFISFKVVHGNILYWFANINILPRVHLTLS